LGGPPVPPSLVKQSGPPDLLVRSDEKFSAVEGIPFKGNKAKASQKSNTHEQEKMSWTAAAMNDKNAQADKSCSRVGEQPGMDFCKKQFRVCVFSHGDKKAASV